MTDYQTRADEHIRAELARLGRECEIACAVKVAAAGLGAPDLAAEAAELAERLSARAFAAVRS